MSEYNWTDGIFAVALDNLSGKSWDEKEAGGYHEAVREFVREGLRRVSRESNVPLDNLRVEVSGSGLDSILRAGYGSFVCDGVEIKTRTASEYERVISKEHLKADDRYKAYVYVLPKTIEQGAKDIISAICGNADLVSLIEAREYARLVKRDARKNEDLPEVILALAFHDFKVALENYKRKYHKFTDENSYIDTGMGPNGTSPLKLR